MTLALYGHPFSSYTWKALIALYACDIRFEFRIVDGEHPEHQQFVSSAGPLGKFPVFSGGADPIFEATSIIEYLALHYEECASLLPADPSEAAVTRMLDRVFDNYVMGSMQIVVDEYIRDAASPDGVRVREGKEKLKRTYRWLDDWLRSYAQTDRITLIECAAAPSLFYADWVHPIADEYPRLKTWRTHLLSLPPVKRCVDDARPYRAWFPPGAPDRD